ncbi:MAG: hypothetical protein AB7S38_19050 [Vulcanimicrobiota bacterium]
MQRNLILLLLLSVVLVGCQPKTEPSGPATPGATGSEATTPEAAKAALEVKIAEGKELSFEPASGWYDPRTDTRTGAITVGSYDFVVTPRNISSVADVTEGQTRVVLGLKSPEGSEFKTPIPAGEYKDDAIAYTDIVYFEDGRQQRYNFENPKGTVVVSDLSDTEMSGTFDLTDDKGAALKGDFKVKVTSEGAAGEGNLPYDFPAMEVAAKPGDLVFAPSDKEINDMLKMGKKNPRGFRDRKMVKPGPETSTVEDEGKSWEVPNSLVISLSKDAKAKKGDIVLSFPKYDDMTRGMVIDAADPTKPKVHFFKPVYGSNKPEGDQFNQPVEPGTFRVVHDGVETGVKVLHPDGSEKGLGQVINVSGDKVLVSTFGGDVAVFDKSDVEPLPLHPKLKAGDKVQAPFAKGVRPATITKVDDKIGRVWLTFENAGTAEGCFSYGEILP